MFRRIISCCDRSNTGEPVSENVHRKKAYELVKTDSESKQCAVAIVDNFFAMLKARKNELELTINKTDDVEDRNRGEDLANRERSATKPLVPIDRNYVREIFEKINEIKQASSGWFGCGRASDEELGKLHQELDVLVSTAYRTFTQDMKNTLSALPKPEVSAATPGTDDTPLLSGRGQNLAGVDYLKNAFDIVMRNDSRVFQVTIPKALAELHEKYKRTGWKTTFIENNVFSSSRYNLPAQIKLKKYSNPFIERCLSEEYSKDDKCFVLEYELTDPRDASKKMPLVVKHRDRATGRNSHTSRRAGEGRFGSVEVHGSQYAKKKYGETKRDQSHRSEEHENVQYLHSYYTACLQFKLQNEELEEMVRLNHPVAWNRENGEVVKAIAKVAKGYELSRGTLTEQTLIFERALHITTGLHRCGAFALDNKPGNYMTSIDGGLTRIDLDFDAQAAALLGERVDYCGNNIECPLGEEKALGSMYDELERCQEGVDKAVIRADFYRGQSLAGLVLCRTKDFLKKRDDGIIIFTVGTANELIQLLKNNLPINVSPHDRGGLINFVVNWHFNRNHREIAEFLTKYRLDNSLMDPREHLPPRTAV